MRLERFLGIVGQNPSSRRNVAGVGTVETADEKRPPGQNLILSFEGLRGLLALTVCTGHLGLNTVGARYGMQVRFELAVDVFFALSGFVLSQAYYFKQRSFRQFAGGRFARLYPLHLLTLGWCWLVLPAQSHTMTQLWQNILAVQNMGLPPHLMSYNFPSWSISVEIAAGVLMFMVLRRPSIWLLAVLIISGVGLSALDAAGGLSPSENYFGVFNSGLMRGISGFCIGVSAFLIVRRGKARLVQLPAWLLALGPLTLLPFFLFPTWNALSAGLFSLAVLATVTAGAVDGGTGALSGKPAVYLGEISYSVYLLHMPILLTVTALVGENSARGMVAKLVILLVIILSATICNRYYERPMQMLFLRLMFRRQSNAGGRFTSGRTRAKTGRLNWGQRTRQFLGRIERLVGGRPWRLRGRIERTSLSASVVCLTPDTGMVIPGRREAASP